MAINRFPTDTKGNDLTEGKANVDHQSKSKFLNPDPQARPQKTNWKLAQGIKGNLGLMDGAALYPNPIGRGN